MRLRSTDAGGLGLGASRYPNVMISLDGMGGNARAAALTQRVS
jgi:hypothetical protein